MQNTNKLKEIILINSANFDFVRVNLSRDLFFLGDNGSGKTSFIRAIHFLYSGDARSIGIPNDKKSFKDYYFRYDNSYIFYVFEDFFIFVYKRANEIVKYFSYQKFDIKMIKGNKAQLLTQKEIISYIKSAPLSKRVNGINEYSDIIYGKDKKFLDFKIADINSKDMFLKLFHTVFNVDKAIIDSKSIKKALFSSLNLSSYSESFEPDYYISKLNEFINNYNFFRSMQKQEKNIKKATELKEDILKIEERLGLYESQINYRKEYEKSLLDSINKNIKDNKMAQTRLQEKISLKQKIKDKFRSKIDGRIDDARYKLSEIKKYRAKFTKKEMVSAQELVSKEPFVRDELDKFRYELIKVKSGLEDSLGSIEQEIKNLRYKKEYQLPQEQKLRENSIYAQIDEDERNQLNTLEIEFEHKRSKLELKIKMLNSEVEELNRDIERISNSGDKLKDQFEETKDSLQQKIYQEEQKLHSKRLENQNDIAIIEQDNIKILSKIESLKEEFKKARDGQQQFYAEEKREIEAQIATFKNMIYSKKGSFKEFLNEEVESWQIDLYPLLDEKLLSKNIDELKPKIISEKVVGIKLDTTNLKRILPADEANEKIDRLKTKLNSLEIEFAKKLQSIDENHRQKKEALELHIRHNILKIKSKKEEKFEEILKEIKTLKEQLKEKKEEQNKKLQGLYQKKTELKQKINLLKISLNKIHKEIREEQVWLKTKQDDLKQKNITKKQKTKKEQYSWLENEKRGVDKIIIDLQKQKEILTKDERILSLEKRVYRLDEEYKNIQKAIEYLKEYEKQKEFINQESYFQTYFSKLKNFKKMFLSKLERNIEEIKGNKEKIKEQNKNFENDKKKILDAIEKLKELEYGRSKGIKTENFLLDIIKRYQELFSLHQSKLIDLKDKLQKINSIKNLNKYDIHFNIDLFEKEKSLGNIASILQNIDSLHEFYYMQLDILKSGQSKNFENFVKNTYSQKLNVFSNTQDNFLKLVSKINKELKEIDFGVIKEIRFNTAVSGRDSISTMLNQLKEKMNDISSIFHSNSLFFDIRDSISILNELEEMFLNIKKELKSDKISLEDTVELSLEFYENGILKKDVMQIKNESSTGGSMLLKIAIAISILKVYIKNSGSVFYLIVDEVSRLHSKNQKRLKEFANKSGFRIIFVTPEPVFANPKELLYYRFVKNDDKFEVIELNRFKNY